MVFGLSDADRAALTALFTRHGIKQATVFGSRARGDFRERSDIDIAIHDALSPSARADLALDLHDAPIPLRIDVVFYNEVSDKHLKQEIDREGVAFAR